MAQTIMVVVQARMASVRLPGKALYPLAGTTVLGFLLNRLEACEGVDRVVVATTTRDEDAPIRRWAEAEADVCVMCPEVDDVLGRFVLAAEALGDDDVVVRLTGDNPLVCPEVVDHCAAWVANGTYDYYRTGDTFPEGLDVEACTVALLRAAADIARLPFEREHLAAVLERLAERPGRYELPQDWGHLRVTLDEPEDVPVVQGVAERLVGEAPSLRALLALARWGPELFAGNAHVVRNAWKQEASS